jgi:hypothetical protein
MAQVLRDAASGNPRVQPATELIDTLAALTPARVIVLKTLRDREPELEPDDHWDGHLVQELGLRRGAIRAALVGMELTGAVESTGSAMDGGDRWRIEEAGLRTLDYLDAVRNQSDDASARGGSDA